MPSTLDQTLGFHATALRLRQHRLELIAANIANADTPGYQARDLDFPRALRLATGGPQNRLTAATTQRGHLRPEPGPGLSRRLLADTQVLRQQLTPSNDGNTVSTQVEHAAFARAAIEYQASLNFLDGQIKSLMTAITGE